MIVEFPIEDANGSSPLTRGKLPALMLSLLLSRLIPAHAGKTRRATRRARRSTAHPRSRGENPGLGCEVPKVGGSSPLTRGKLLPPGIASARTPAHPRSRGENRAATWRAIPACGSSPLTRGKRNFDDLINQVDRLIPAHAGKTVLRHRASMRRGAHPRSRGENGYLPLSGHQEHGSSPLTRGKPHLAGQPPQSGGLIPAHAGKTASKWNKPSEKPAHPRSRGENAFLTFFALLCFGSSPLTRGKLSHSRRERCGGRLIPAHAGKTAEASGRACAA